MNATYFDQLAGRLTAHVSAKLGVPVEFAEWREHKTGAQVPVFAVPATHAQQARELGLTIA